jgi:hypothetical protein
LAKACAGRRGKHLAAATERAWIIRRRSVGRLRQA